MHVHLRMGVHVVKQPLVVVVLLVPLQSLIVAEIVSQRNQDHFAAEQLGLLPVLVQKELCPDTVTQMSVKLFHGFIRAVHKIIF